MHVSLQLYTCALSRTTAKLSLVNETLSLSQIICINKGIKNSINRGYLVSSLL